MLERTRMHLADGEVMLGVVCRREHVSRIRAYLEAEGCRFQEDADDAPSLLTTEDLFPGFHAGNALRGARYREDVSQRELSRLTGVSVRNISAMENGRRPIGKEMARRFATVLNTDWRLLLS